MPNAKLDPELAVEAVRVLRAEGSQVKAALRLGIARQTLQNRLAHAARLGLDGSVPAGVPAPGFVVAGNAGEYDADGSLRKQWVKTVPDAGEEYEVPAGHVVKGESALVNPDGRILAKWVKTRLDGSALLVDAIKDAFTAWEGHAPLAPAPAWTDADLLTVYPIADQHNGMLSWGRETGESYDLRIGAERLRTCAAQLIAQSRSSKTAIVLNLGDWQHADDQRNVTPAHQHQLDVDGRWRKVLMVGVQLMMDVIEMALAKHEHVIVRNIPGNHDPHASFALTVALGAFYRANPRVTVDNDPGEWWFYRHGTTLLGACHGHRCKPERMAMTMACTRREDWGVTKFHRFYYGHIHHQSAIEVGDVVCESFQTLAAKDAHAAAGGYNSGQSLQAITHHIETGELGRHRVNIVPPTIRAMATAA